MKPLISSKVMAGVHTNTFRANLTNEETVMMKNVKQHYGFRTDRELFIALLKKAHLHINTKPSASSKQ